MIQPRSLVKIADNSGGTLGAVFKVLGSSKKRYATIGDLVVISIKVASPRKMVKKKDIHEAVVILEKGKLDPKAGRVFGPMPRELAEKGFQKIISLAPEVI